MTAHTPGPWFIRQDEGYFDIVSDGRAWAIVGSEGCDSEANARLIAAAPDLLEALKEVFVIGEKLVDDVYGYEFRQMAKAAIAKATGEGA